jgi:alkylation response protein AidB-like acyl-CoA dehydrogenase
MTVADKHLKGDERESLELAEESRQREWTYPSFVSRLFQGAIDWDLVFPFPEQSGEDREEGDKYLNSLDAFLKERLNPDEVDVTREIPPGVVKGLIEMGAFAMKILGFSQMNYNRAVHLVSSYCGSTAALLSAHQSIGVPQPLLLFGTEEQKKRYLPRFRKGSISGFALTEEEAGSDPRMMKTTATPVEGGNSYILNGEKLWCTNGNIADVLVVMAQTPPKIVDGKEKKQITAFIVDTDTPGFEVVHRCKFMGLNAIQNGLMRFNDVKVSKENIILGEGEGLKLAFVTLNTGRLTLPAGVTGISKWCLWVSRKWAEERKQWGSVIGEHEAIASKLSYMASTIFAMEAVTWLTTFLADNKKSDIRLEAAMAKLFCSEESWKIVYDAIQVRGGRGYETASSLKERGKEGFPLERAMRDMRINTILEGSSEIMHLFIAREALDFHVERMKPLLEGKGSFFRKVKAASSIGFKYLFWYTSLWIPSFSRSPKDLTRPLNTHRIFVSKNARRLARGLFHKMLIYRQNLARKQNIINRFVDIGTDLFAMSCACSYADKLHKKGNGKGNAIELADLFCRQARRRIRKNFKDVGSNDDGLSNSLAKKILAGEFEWLEDDIIKKESPGSP